jgi:hypothetical protein
MRYFRKKGEVIMPFCRKCGKEIETDARFCKFCGANQLVAPIQPTVPPTPSPTIGLETKNSGLAAILALILGFFGLWGVGHIYVGKITKGIVLIILGVFIGGVIGRFVGFGFLGSIFVGISDPYYFRYTPVAAIVGIIMWFAITIGCWLWQVYDAYKLAKYYNQYVQQNRRAPW